MGKGKGRWRGESEKGFFRERGFDDGMDWMEEKRRPGEGLAYRDIVV